MKLTAGQTQKILQDLLDNDQSLEHVALFISDNEGQTILSVVGCPRCIVESIYDRVKDTKHSDEGRDAIH